MERCTLCGGKLADGKCTECGLDNTRNDRRYRLNVHNEKGVTLHSGDCEEHLNRDSDWKEKLRAKRAAVSAGPAQKSRRKRTRELAERRQTGTVKKKISPAVVLLCLLVIFLAVSVLVSVIGRISDLGRNAFGSILNSVRSEPAGENREIPEEPEPAGWEEALETYVELELAPGFYQAGYEIPAGRYQFVCREDSVEIYWRGPDEDRGEYLCLYDPERQESYEDLFDEPCPYFARSEIVALEDGAVVWVDGDESNAVLEGEAADPEDLRSREPQNLTDPVILEPEMKAGEDFEAGVYDVVMELPDDPDAYAARYVEVSDPGKTGSLYISLNTGRTRYLRVPFRDGNTVTVEEYGAEDCHVRLIPSY